MKKAILFLLAGAVLCFTACSQGEGSSSAAAPTVSSGAESSNAPSTSVGVPNPLVDRGSVEEAEEAMGVDCKVPSEPPAGYEQIGILTIDDRVLQILYEKDGAVFTYRTGAAADNEGDDLSGDYNEYDDEVTENVGGQEVTLRGNSGTGADALWSSGYWADGDMLYAFYADEPISTADLEIFIGGIV